MNRARSFVSTIVLPASMGLSLALALAALAFAGCIGADGPEGLQGPPGETGPKGAPGDTGAKGDRGSDGGAGPKGDPGQSSWLAGAGLKLGLGDVTVDASGKTTIAFSLADASDRPLDREGKYSEGAVEVHFVLAWLDEKSPGDPLQYRAYTTRQKKGASATATQASVDEGGTFTTVDLGKGLYRYELATKADPANAGRTHTAGAYATRAFGGKTYSANETKDFVPSGAQLLTTREVVDTKACNGCHGRLEQHQEVRREVHLCVLCHSPETSGGAANVDPDSGNTLDFKVMVHKLHRGEALPSVVGGTPYVFASDEGPADFSTVAFPRDIRLCGSCHAATPQGDFWKTRPTRAACGSCHDDISFVDPPPQGMKLHPGFAQKNDDNCTVCHQPQGGLHGVTDSHWTALTDPNGLDVQLGDLAVSNTAPGQQPTLTFTVKVNGAPRNILASPMTSLRVTVAGPTSDIAGYWQATIQGSGASGTLSAVDAANGKFQYVLPPAAAIPASASGSYAFGLEGSIKPDPNAAATYFAFNPVTYGAVSDKAPAPRRKVVEAERCQSCHYRVEAHGGSRNNPNYCVLCHNPNNDNDERVARLESTTVVAQPVDFKVMIHKIHRGEQLAQPYVLGGFPVPSVALPGGTPVSFNELRFPNDLRACDACHADGTWKLPLGANVRPSRYETLTCTEDPAADGNNYCNTRSSVEGFIPPTTAVCTACHDAAYTAAHAQVMTTPGGVESCATCHGPGTLFDIELFHQRKP